MSSRSEHILTSTKGRPLSVSVLIDGGKTSVRFGIADEPAIEVSLARDSQFELENARTADRLCSDLRAGTNAALVARRGDTS